MSDEITYKIIQRLEQNPEISQRALSLELGVSLGKVNYCLRALVDKGWVKVNNFRNSSNKMAYRYLLTSRGMQEKAVVAAAFLKRKMAEYEALQHEIEQLRKEIEEKKQ